MHVVATAGHVDHGKSALVRALTGREPDRLAQERERGLSIELGYVWTTLPAAGDVAFVDVPGHERFISTTLAGLGPVPVVLFVVAADDPWMPQAAEHLAALDALGVRRGLLIITRADLADPAEARAAAAAELARTSLRGVPALAVSSRTGEGIPAVREALDALLADTPPGDADAPARLWVDRSFSAKGAGTVVTGTLQSGTIRAGDDLAHGAITVRVRSVETLGRRVPQAAAPARVALNVTGAVERGDVLVQPGAWHHSSLLDVRLHPSALAEDAAPPRQPLLHIGASTMAVQLRRLGEHHARLQLPTPLPLRIGDRGLIRDPGTRRLWGLTVLDPVPPGLGRRGAAARRGAALRDADGSADLATEVARRGIVARLLLRQLGVDGAETAQPPAGVIEAGEWLLSSEHAAELSRHALRAVRDHSRAGPLQPALTLAGLAAKLGVPNAAVVQAIIRPPLHVREGQVVEADEPAVAPEVTAAVAALRAELVEEPFAAPTAERMAALGLTDEVLAAAVRAGLALRLDRHVVLPAGADDAAARLLAQLPQPFTVSQARQQLGTSRRVAVPLLAHLDRTGRTRRQGDDRRRVT